MAQEYGMSRQTVRQALSLLEQEDLIERRQGSGTYVRCGAAPAQALLERGGDGHLYQRVHLPLHPAGH